MSRNDVENHDHNEAQPLHFDNSHPDINTIHPHLLNASTQCKKISYSESITFVRVNVDFCIRIKRSYSMKDHFSGFGMAIREIKVSIGAI